MIAIPLAAGLPLPEIEFSSVLLPTAIVLSIALVLHGLFAVSTNQHNATSRPRSILTMLLYLVFQLVVIGLAVTSFGSIVQFGHMSGYALLAHVAGAGAFTFLLLAIAFLFLPFGDADFSAKPLTDQRWWLSRWSIWALVVASLVTAGTMFLSMLPILGTEGLLAAAEVHRYAGLATVVAALISLYAITISKMGWR